MKVFSASLTPHDESRLNALARWSQLLDNRQLRMDCPNEYHDQLLRQADEMDRVGIVSWQEWRDLRIEADQRYLSAIAGADYAGIKGGADG
ncbi:hypothetical protein J2W83_002127 [Pseudomonas hunanensis]|uniref:Uncharacterized protein n=1 Tax=Pseudomonas hunanensis TaxID=1247546 RepID=A0ACC6K292_9PSED|nr:hypothetical protein [Pseudomonas hunanensis]MDR6712526.1 hypothetical protein [Pseudomonas hunanensis]